MTTAVPVDREKPGGPRSRKGVATRARLLEAAKAVFEEDGFLEARISDIADRAGLSHGSFYHYFDSKEQIFREVANELSDLLHAPLSTAIFDHTSTASPQERIRAGNRRFLEDYRREARIIGVIEQVSRYDEHLNTVRFEHQKRDRERIANSIAQLQRRGWVDPSLNPLIAASALGAMVTRFAEMWLVQGLFDTDFDEGAEQLTRLFLNALHLRDKPTRADVPE
ncbi:TetR/AcrR family transcriptional regulator [Frankia sp. CNm7]|uniref:TetR/AcrR family transcriptional regulator n=1 Tax=Frankia nepalensis TaxID=1836974 RepID=A0A937UQ87_9ACTN|nr:TetR/AcrR family transcriptional regulator [Frankia nepalensis]MBL7509431.1 TetR/AcrR family transcriptional regulator [Frankia nepalensis]MBL7524811.1 TetR/AcrR family transcriptional regulator [Frankia nepalensis]MBL7631619.1 TetR/AcrR family transcriptional regulator [Frankia nepalensis]